MEFTSFTQWVTVKVIIALFDVRHPIEFGDLQIRLQHKHLALVDYLTFFVFFVELYHPGLLLFAFDNWSRRFLLGLAGFRFLPIGKDHVTDARDAVLVSVGTRVL